MKIIDNLRILNTSMRMTEILNEKLHRFEIGDNIISVHENPRPSQLIGLLENARYKNLRGLIAGPNVYWWDSFYAEHHAISNLVGVPLENEDDPRRMLLYLQPDKSIFLDVWPQYRTHPQIAPLIEGRYNVLVEVKKAQ